MTTPRRPLALLSLVAVLAAGLSAGLACAQNSGLGLANDVGAVAVTGIEGEGDIPLPVARS